MELSREVEELLTFSRYLSWADLVRRAHEAECRRRIDNGVPAPAWGADFAWMSYWYSSLFVVVEAYEAIEWCDPVIDALLGHGGGYKDLLKRFRNGVFHYQSDPVDARLLRLLNTGEEHVLWVYALHNEFMRLLRDRISAFAITPQVGVEVERILRNLLDWLPEEPEILEFDHTMERVRALARRDPIPGLEEQHAEIHQSLTNMARIRATYDEKHDRFRRELLYRLGITVADAAGG